MKELFIIRHGKSSWDIEGISDIDRSLKERGVKDGYKMAERLKSQNSFPDKIFTSSAIRALHSAIVFARVLKYPTDNITIIEDMYHAGTSYILDLIKHSGEKIHTLMIFGHNPTFTDVANYFTGNKIDNVPTTGIVHIKFNADTWSDINPKNVEDWFFDYPKHNH